VSTVYPAEMVLGYRGKPNWRDMSDYLVHFTPDRQTLEKIIKGLRIEVSGPLGAIPKHPSLASLPNQASCCLSEIPLEYLDRLTNRHGEFGVGFAKHFVRDSNGARVWYLDQGVDVQQSLFKHAQSGWFANVDPADVVWELTPFIDYVMPNHEFEWEREWRVRGGLDFSSSDVAFFFAPESEHNGLTTALGFNVLGIDTSWTDVRLQQAIANLPPTATP